MCPKCDRIKAQVKLKRIIMKLPEYLKSVVTDNSPEGYIQVLISWGVHQGKAHYYVTQLMGGEPDCLKQPIRSWSKRDWKLKLLRAKIRKEVSRAWRLHIDLKRWHQDRMVA